MSDENIYLTHLVVVEFQNLIERHFLSSPLIMTRIGVKAALIQVLVVFKVRVMVACI